MKLNTKITIIDTFSTLDWIIFTTILLITVAAIAWGYIIKNKSISEDKSEQANILDYLIMGRKLTLPLFTATLVATWYGGIFGVTRIAFEKGVYNFVTQGFFWYLTYIIFAFFLVSKIKSYKAITLPELTGQMFGPKASIITSIFNFFNVLPIAYVISIGLLLQLIVPGPLLPRMFLGVSIVIIYSMFGGFRAVVFSDLIQFVVMCTSVVLVLFFSFYNFGGISFLTEHLPDRYFSVTGGEPILTTLVWGFIALSTLVDPNFYQRVFAAKSTKVAKKGILISTGVWFLFDICTTLGAMYAKATIPETNPDYSYLTYALQILPSGLRGFVLAGIVATILSTLDSYLFIAGTTLSYDLAPKKYKGSLILHHLGIVFVGLLAVLMATLFDGNIKTVWKTLGSYSAACLLLPIVYGYIFPKKISDMQFVVACLFGVVATTYWRLAPHGGFLANLDELYAGIIATSAGLFIFHIASNMTTSKN